MRAVTIWPLFLANLAINADITLESVDQKVNDLEIELNTLKVNVSKYNYQGYGPLFYGPYDNFSQTNIKCNEFRMKTRSSGQMLNF